MGMPDITKEIETLYTGKATIYGAKYVDNGHGAKKLAQNSDVEYENVPCRLSYDRTEANSQDRFGQVVQEIVLFLNPQYNVKTGAKIEVTQEGATHTYECGGLRAMYKSHQEIKLIAYRETA